MRIVFVPVDERFCTKDYFLMLADAFSLEVVHPQSYGLKKIPADTDYIKRWLWDIRNEADIFLISLDMVVFGGLVPSRIGYEKFKTLRERLEFLRNLKEPGKKIYAAVSVTRVPAYNSSEEEPDYWEYYGKKLWSFSKGEKEDIPEWILKDFLWRRERNKKVVGVSLELVKDGIIDFLLINLDDNSPGTLVAREGEEHRRRTKELGIEGRAIVKNGTDESMLILLARALVDQFGYSPHIAVEYTFPKAVNLIPPYHSNALEEAVWETINSCGMLSDGEDGILYVHNARGSERTSEAPFQSREDWLRDFGKLRNALNSGKYVGIADVRYANGADMSLAKYVVKNVRDWEKICYYSWNTCGNTLGSTCTHLALRIMADRGFLVLNEEKLLKYQLAVFLENVAYQTFIRERLREEARKKGCQASLIPCEEWAKDFVSSQMRDFLRENLPDFSNIEFDVYFPWHRPFEVGVRMHDLGKKAK